MKYLDIVPGEKYRIKKLGVNSNPVTMGFKVGDIVTVIELTNVKKRRFKITNDGAIGFCPAVCLEEV